MNPFAFARRVCRRFLADESGATAVEYALLLALVAVTCVAATIAFRPIASNQFGSVGESVGTYADP
jgi:pilus assembly protein Flp/PilA